MRLSSLTAPILKGKPVRLTVLDYGYFRVLSGPRDVGLMGFLVDTDADERVLIDTGMPRKYAKDPMAAGKDDGLDKFGHVIELDDINLPAAQLALSNIAMSDIDMLIITHTHIDHMGGLEDPPDAPILMARAERALDRPLYWADRNPIPWPDRDYLLVEQDMPLGPGFDLFFVPGHAPGQLAFMVWLPETGPVLLTSDAISRPAEVTEGFKGSWNEELAQHHGARLMTLADANDAWVIYGHCPEQWFQLRKAPDAYH